MKRVAKLADHGWPWLLKHTTNGRDRGTLNIIHRLVS